MEYTIYIILGTLFFSGLLYFTRKVVKRINHNKLILSELDNAPPATNDMLDDFMCLSVSDGSTIISVGGVSVRGNARKSSVVD